MRRTSVSAAILALSLAVTSATPGLFAQTTTDQNAQQSAQPQDSQQQRHGKWHHHRAEDPQKAAAHLSKRLGLSPDQTAKVEPILADREQKVQALRGDTSMNEQQRRDAMRTIHQNTEQQLAGVLTPEQMDHLKSMHKGGGRHHGGPGAAPSAAPTGA